MKTDQAYLSYLAATQGLIYESKPPTMKLFSWDNNTISYTRTEEIKDRVKKNRRKKRARKTKRGY